MNTVCICGRLTRDPKTQTFVKNNTTVSTFTLAVDRRKKDDGADFIRCSAFGKAAEVIENYVHKGDMFGVTGRLSTRSYDDKDGKRAYITEVIVSDFTFLQSRSKKTTAPVPQSDDVYGKDIPF